MARTVQGNNHTWQVSDSPIGSGDAGEVYAVARLDLPDLTGVMKKPARVATGGTIQRQAGQIAREALALAKLDGLPRGKAHPPRLLDTAPEFTQGTANYFIISETAPGENFASLLNQTRQTGKPFPRRVIITVLDALFDMFSRAHEVGVLWNDVKLDHIYWHNPTGQVAVIDWGNALFLEEGDHKGQPIPPRWKDYQQMVDTLGQFLQTYAPELYDDLGWDEFQGQVLDSPRVSILARRISYQQQVIALQVMEFQSLIKVVLNGDPTHEGLQKIIEYKQVLERMGAPWEGDSVLDYGQSLVETALAGEDRQATVSATALIWEIFDDSLDLNWHLLREYCRYTDILTHKAFPSLAKSTLYANWVDALWEISTIASELGEPEWWGRLIPVMRQGALGIATPPPYQGCQSLRNWALEEGDTDLAQKLMAALQNWRVKGSDLRESPFDYDCLDLIREDANLPRQLRSEIKNCFAPGEEVIRNLLNVWTEANWDALGNAFRRVVSWDPDRWGILKLADQVRVFQTWSQELYDGPGVGVNARSFLVSMLDSRPRVESLLGSTPWLIALMNMLNRIIQGGPISAFQDDVTRYCPWLQKFSDIFAADISLPDLDQDALNERLSHFVRHLKTWSDVDAGLSEIRDAAPQVYPLCNRLADGFKYILTLNANLEQLPSLTGDSTPQVITESFAVLQALIAWREGIASKDLTNAIKVLQTKLVDGWRIAVHARQVTTDWQELILPALESIRTYALPANLEDEPSVPHHKQLLDITRTCAELPLLWAQINDFGVHAQLLENLQSRIEGVRMDFLEWRVALESSADRTLRLLYLNQLDNIRQISNNFLRMAGHIRQARLSFMTLSKGDHMSLTLQMKSIENVLDHLIAIEAELVADSGQWQFPDYQHAFKQIKDAANHHIRQSLVSALQENHPFYTWLVKSTVASDKFNY